MNRTQAEKVLEHYEAARLKVCAGSGNGTAFDRLGEQYRLSAGQAMTLYYEARNVVERGATSTLCSNCFGRGHE